MSFFNKIYDITHTDLFKYVFHTGSDKVFVVNISKITTVNEDVVDSKWTLTSHTVRHPLMLRDNGEVASSTHPMVCHLFTPTIVGE